MELSFSLFPRVGQHSLTAPHALNRQCETSRSSFLKEIGRTVWPLSRSIKAKLNNLTDNKKNQFPNKRAKIERLFNRPYPHDMLRLHTIEKASPFPHQRGEKGNLTGHHLGGEEASFNRGGCD